MKNKEDIQKELEAMERVQHMSYNEILERIKTLEWMLEK